jgi:GT2 family glycosyltransferase
MHILPKIAIVVLNWNGIKDTIPCMESLFAIDYPYCDIILVDNGSTDGSPALLQERFPRVHHISLPVNQGFAGGNNPGITSALERGAEYVVLLNNDTVVASDLLHRFLDGFNKEPRAGILGARIYLFDQRDTLDHLGGIWIKSKAQVQLVGLREKETLPVPDTLLPLDYVCGACMIIKRSVFEAIGLLEPRFFLYWEENDFCLRAQRAGFLTFSCPTAHIWHKVAASSKGKPYTAYFIWRSRLLWIERNYSLTSKIWIHCTQILPACIKLLKLALFKKIQLVKDHPERREKLLNYKAALTGIRDYYLRRFDRGPLWIYKKY